MNKNFSASKLIILPAAILLLAAGCNSASPQQNTKTFSTTIQTGFEGYFTDTTISMDYNTAQFSIATDPEMSTQILITDLETGAIAGIRILNNDGPGFGSSTDAWNNLNLCQDCKAATDQIGLSGYADIKSFESNVKYWQIFQMDPGFVIIQADKPLNPFVQVIKLIKFSNSKITPA